VSPRKLTTKPADRSVAVGRRRIAQKYLEVAELIASEDGAAINVTFGLAVLAGIAAADAICISATGERYAGQDHAAAADLLGRVDRDLGRRLRDLVALKPTSHFGQTLLGPTQRTQALRAAQALVAAAVERTS